VFWLHGFLVLHCVDDIGVHSFKLDHSFLVRLLAFLVVGLLFNLLINIEFLFRLNPLIGLFFGDNPEPSSQKFGYGLERQHAEGVDVHIFIGFVAILLKNNVERLWLCLNGFS
jgi:hypothetical protein